MLVRLSLSVSGALMMRLTTCCCSVNCLLSAGLAVQRLRLAFILQLIRLSMEEFQMPHTIGVSGQTPCNRDDDTDFILNSAVLSCRKYCLVLQSFLPFGVICVVGRCMSECWEGGVYVVSPDLGFSFSH